MSMASRLGCVASMLLAGLTTQTTAHAEESGGLFTVGGTYGATVGSAPLKTAGLEVSWMHYPATLFKGGYGFGAFAQIESAKVEDFGRHLRAAAGVQASFALAFGTEIGLAYRAPNAGAPGTTSIQCTPYFSIGLLTIGLRIAVPLRSFQAEALPSRELEVGLYLSPKAFVPAYGTEGTKSIFGTGGWGWGRGRPLRSSTGMPIEVPVHFAYASLEQLPSRSAWGVKYHPPIEANGDTDRQLLAESWLTDAHMEHISVGAFAALSRQLIAHGSPLHLLRSCHQAAAQEIGHADVCFGLARWFGDRDVEIGTAPDVLTIGLKPLHQLLTETLIDGVLGEGIAAAVATEAALTTNELQLCAVLTKIAAEETEHRDFAIETALWIVRREPALAAHARTIADNWPLLDFEGAAASTYGCVAISTIATLAKCTAVVCRNKIRKALQGLPGPLKS